MTDAIDTDDLEVDEAEETGPLATDTRDQPLRYSVLKAMKQSPRHALHQALRQSDGPSLALRLGSGCHGMTFGTPEVVQYNGKQRRGKDWEAFQEAHPGAVILNAKEYAKAKGMADSIAANEVARRVLFAPNVIREQRIDWEWNGRKWRSTPDAQMFRVLAELKTTRCADPAVFWRDALRLSYHCQLALYRRAIEQTTSVRPQSVYLFAVESVAPYVVTPFKLSERSLEHGDMLAKRWHEQFLKCEATGKWPGYTDGVEELDVYEIEDESAMEVERAMANDDGRRASVSW